MTTISMSADSALSGAIRSHAMRSDIYLTLRDGDGAVMYSASVKQWSTDRYEATATLLPTAERIDRAAEMYADVKRIQLTEEAREKGLL